MIRILFYMVLASLCCACNSVEKPIFKEIKSLEITDLNPDYIRLKGVALYHNPNAISGQITSSLIDIAINDISIGQIEQDTEIEVPARNDFEIEFQFGFPLTDILQQEGLFGNIASLLIKPQLEFHFNGSTHCKFMNIPFEVPVDYVKSIKLGKSDTQQIQVKQ